jgi:hypothetical protein
MNAVNQALPFVVQNPEVSDVIKYSSIMRWIVKVIVVDLDEIHVRQIHVTQALGRRRWIQRGTAISVQVSVKRRVRGRVTGSFVSVDLASVNPNVPRLRRGCQAVRKERIAVTDSIRVRQIADEQSGTLTDAFYLQIGPAGYYDVAACAYVDD